MRIFADRAFAQENAHIHAQSLSYRLLSHRTKLFGQRIAEELGYYGPDADDYANSLVEHFAETDSDESLVDRVLCDLYDLGIAEERDVIARKLHEAEILSDDCLF